jgi:cyclopropane-fatty-acyl-phospholipid synthase
MSTHIHPPLGTAAAPAVRPVDRAAGASGRRATWSDRWVARRVQQTIAPANVRLELWDRSSPYDAARPPIGDLVVHDRRTLVGLAVNPDLYFGEAYMAGRLDVRGPLEPVVEALSRLSLTPSWRSRIGRRLVIPNTLRAARDNVHHHYDLGNSFYQQWLDRELVYTCAYFEREEMSLDDAQRAKMDLVCRKLRLQSGDTVVEAGCGWGALALFMARHYGVHVKAFNVSREQLAFARERAAREGLASRVEFIDDDYRNVRGTFDVFVSIGMLEHVGLHRLKTLAEVLRRTVRRDGGRGLLHFIGRDTTCPLNPWVRRRIFPGAYPPTLAEVTTRVLVPAGMSVVDVENLRLHYARTLDFWASNYEAAKDSVRQTYGDQFTRAWELYLAGSQAAFASGWMQLFQVLFAPRESVPPFWSRADLYTDSGRQQ